MLSRRKVNASQNVVRHMAHMGQTAVPVEQRLSLPLRPIGQKESRYAMREKISRKLVTAEPMRNFQPPHPVTKLTEDNGASKQLVHRTRVDDHELCLPDWLMKRLRPMWAHFDEPPPTLRPTETGSQSSGECTVTQVHARLRKGKENCHTDIDEMFANMGLNMKHVKAVIGETPERHPSHTAAAAQSSSHSHLVSVMDQQKMEYSRDQENEDPELPDTVNTSPARKRVRRVLEFLSQHNQTLPPTPIDLDVTTETIGSTHSLPGWSSGVNCTRQQSDIPRDLGLDILTLQLCSMPSTQEDPNTRIEPTLRFQDSHRESMTNQQSNRRYAADTVKHYQHQLEHIEEESEQPREYVHRVQKSMRENKQHRIPRVMEPPRAATRSFKQKTDFGRHVESNRPAMDSVPWWPIPLGNWNNPIEKEIPLDTRIVSAHSRPVRQEVTPEIQNPYDTAGGPPHPMWDTPDELRTSVNLINFFRD